MNYIVKDLVFKKNFNNEFVTYVTNIKIHNILNIEIKIIERVKDDTYCVDFYANNGNKIFEMSDEPCSHYYKYGFTSYKEAYEYANKEIKCILNNFISSVLVDIDDYIEEIDEV